MSTTWGMNGSYGLIGPIGQGSFGLVVKARKIETGETVAIKRILLKGDRKSEIEIIRETFALRNTSHRNIVKLLDVITGSDTVSLVMEFVESNLKAAIEDICRPLNDNVIKYYFFQLLCGVAYLHSLGIMHRDIKPENVLVSSEGVLKITDFGQSCLYFADDPNRTYEHQVASRWYRAPELLFGSVHYTPKVDTWACGCILAELYNGAPLFSGRNDLEQIGRVISVLGTPSNDNWKGWSELPDSHKITFDKVDPVQDWRTIVPLASGDGMDLLQHLIVYSPEQRFSAREAVSHDFFIESIPLTAPYIPPLRSESVHLPTVLEYDPSVDVRSYFYNTTDL